MREELLRRGLSPRTAALYEGEALRVAQWCTSAGTTLDKVTGAQLERYLLGRPRTWSTRKLIRSALQHYWQLSGRKDPPVWAIPVPRKPRMRCRALEPDEASRLVAAAKHRGDAKGLAVLFALYAGLRRAEIAAVRWDDISDGWLRVIGKGGVQASLPLHPDLLAAILVFPRTPGTPWVFPGTYGRPSNPTTIWLWVRAVSEEAGLGRVETHRLRHTCLATANDATGDLRAVQELARHARPETTAGYTRVTERRLRAAVQSLDY